MPIKIAIALPKGGVGKTTLTYHLGSYLSESMRVLYCDLDPQFNLSQLLGFGDVDHPAHELLLGPCNLDEYLISVDDNSCLIGENFQGNLLDLKVGRSSTIPKAIENFSRNLSSVDFDVILFDCAPDVKTATTAALVVCDYILVPAPPEDFTILGINALNKTLKNNTALQSKAQFIIPYKVHAKMNVDKEVLAKIQSKYADNCLESVPFSTNFREAAKRRKPIWGYKPGLTISKIFRKTLEELWQRINPPDHRLKSKS